MRAVFSFIAMAAAGFSRQLEGHTHTYKGELEVDTKAEITVADEDKMKTTLGPLIATTLDVDASTVTVDTVTKTDFKYAVAYSVVVESDDEDALKTAITGQEAKLPALITDLKTALDTQEDIAVTITTALAVEDDQEHTDDTTDKTYKGAIEIDTAVDVSVATEDAVKQVIGGLIQTTLLPATVVVTADSVVKTGSKYAVEYSVAVTAANEAALKTAIDAQADKLEKLATDLKAVVAASSTDATFTAKITTPLAESTAEADTGTTTVATAGVASSAPVIGAAMAISSLVLTFA
mmetsp:Transcript_1616/g.2396  ORF Transcript_1616/g.2396 Transcript_1616/m.2396 type:complete len:293 (-) Transcript_1616:109-987(-)